MLCNSVVTIKILKKNWNLVADIIYGKLVKLKYNLKNNLLTIIEDHSNPPQSVFSLSPSHSIINSPSKIGLSNVNYIYICIC